MNKNSLIKMVVCDVDGVLLDNDLGGFKDILVLLGKSEEVKKIDEKYQRRKHLGPWGLEQLAELYKGFPEKHLNELAFDYCEKNLMKGAKEFIDELKKRKFLVGALSSNPQFIMNALKKILSLKFSNGGELEFKDGITTGKIVKKMDRYLKAETLIEKMNSFDLIKENVAVIGDSITDLPMAEKAGCFIAFNTNKKEIIEKANINVKEKDLKRILKLI